MTEYEIVIKRCKNNWNLHNSDTLKPIGLQELKQSLQIIKEQSDKYEIEIDCIYKYMPYGCYKDVTKRYIK